MRRRLWIGATLAAACVVAGCGGGSTAVSITVSPSSATVRLGTQVQFVPNVTNSTNTVQWSVNGLAIATSTQPSGNSTVGTVDTTGIYTAPLSIPLSGTTPNTTVTITASVQNTSATVSATITLDSGVRVSISPTTFNIGTGENFQFTATVIGVAGNTSLSGVCVASGTTPPAGNTLPPCNAVTWTLTGNGTNSPGTIAPATGAYTAPGVATTASITATSVFDTTEATTVTANITAATDPTITSISPQGAALGTPFQDIYVTGTNFISTTNVYEDGVSLGAPQTQSVSNGATLHVRLFDTNLTPGVHTFTVSRQNGAQQVCPPATPGGPPNPTPCQLVLSVVRPAVIGAPPTIGQATGSGTVNLNVDGGYFGSHSNPLVTVKVGGKPETAQVSTGTTGSNNVTKDRQLNITVNASDLSVPGLYPIEVDSTTASVPPAIVNVAVQPNFSSAPAATPLTVGTSPAAVAVNSATGIAVVVNQGSNDATLIDLTQTPPAVVGFICTGQQGAMLTASESTTCPAADPTAVAIDDVLNVALVANSGTGSASVAVLNLGATPQQARVAFLPTANDLVFDPTGANNLTPTLNPGTTNATNLVPTAIGINPTTGRAIIAYQSTNIALIADLTPLPANEPTVVGVVNVANGLHAHVGVSDNLNWALVTPGLSGSLSIVDLGRQNQATIAAAPGGALRTSGSVTSTATITTTAAHALQVGEPVYVTGVSDHTFNGYYTVASVPSSTTFTYAQASSLPAVATGVGGGTASYASPITSIATSLTVQGVAVNDETEQALLIDPEGSAEVLSLLNQSVNLVSFTSNFTNSGEETNLVAAAFNPLADFAVVVNNTTGDGILIDPAKQTPLSTNLLASGSSSGPVDVAIEPVTNRAIIVNQVSNSVNVFSLPTLRSAPEILHVSSEPTSPPVNYSPLPGPEVVDGPSVTIGSTLLSGVGTQNSPPVLQQTLTITGGGFTGSSQVKLDGTAFNTTFVSTRELRATVPFCVSGQPSPCLQLVPHRYSLEVADSSSSAVSNASSLTVVQRVDLTQGNAPGCTQPQPQAVAIDDTNNLIAVTEPGCNAVGLIDLATGIARSSALASVIVGSQPEGVDVLPSLGIAVVSNFSGNSASSVNELTAQVVGTTTTDASPIGVAVDRGSGVALVTASAANVLDEFSAAAPGTPTTNAVGQTPFGVAVDPVSHLAAVTNSSANTVSLVDLTGINSTQTVTGLSTPEGVALDPCNTTDQLGNCVAPGFLVASATSDSVVSIAPATLTVFGIGVGLNPTTVAYNFSSGTLVTTNVQSATMSVVDFLDQTVRAIISVTPSTLFGVAIHSPANPGEAVLAVVADTTNNQVLLVPLPR